MEEIGSRDLIIERSKVEERLNNAKEKESVTKVYEFRPNKNTVINKV